MAWLVGYPRENIDWFPTVDLKRCVKCGICLNCGKKVYDWTGKGPVVSRPYNCVVGCNTCANLCLGSAISFQDIEEIRKIYRENKIWSKVKRSLEAEGVLPQRAASSSGKTARK